MYIQQNYIYFIIFIVCETRKTRERKKKKLFVKKEAKEFSLKEIKIKS